MKNGNFDLMKFDLLIIPQYKLLNSCFDVGEFDSNTLHHFVVVDVPQDFNVVTLNRLALKQFIQLNTIRPESI